MEEVLNYLFGIALWALLIYGIYRLFRKKKKKIVVKDGQVYADVSKPEYQFINKMRLPIDMPESEKEKRMEQFHALQGDFDRNQNVLLKNGQYQEVIDNLEYFSLITPYYLELKAKALKGKGRTEEAYQLFENILNGVDNKYKKDILNVELAEIDFAYQQYSNVITRLQTLDPSYFKEDDDKHDIKIQLGDAFMKIGKPELAINAYKLAPTGSKSPDKALIRVIEKLGDAYAEMGKKTPAINAYNKVLSFNYSERVEEKLEKLQSK